MALCLGIMILAQAAEVHSTDKCVALGEHYEGSAVATVAVGILSTTSSLALRISTDSSVDWSQYTLACGSQLQTPIL